MTAQAPDTAAVSASPQTAPRLGLVLTVCCLAQFLVTLSVAVVNIALPAIQSSLGFSASSLQWVVNAYTITFAGFLLLGGRIADLFGRRRIFLAGIALFTLASLVGGISQNSGTLVTARAVQGLAAAVIAPTTLAVLGTTFTDPHQRHKAFGAWGAVSGAGGAFGALAGGVLTDQLSWRWILFINIPIGVVLFAGVAWVITELRHEGSGKRLDVPGAVAVTAGLLVLVLGIVQSGPHGWDSAQTLVPLVAGLLLIGVFVLIEGRFAAEPLMPLGIFRSRSVTAANVVAMTSGAALFGTFYFLTLFLHQVRDYSPLRTGFAYLPLAVSIMVAAQFSAALVRRTGARVTLVAGMTLTAGGLLWLAFLDENSTFAAAVLGPTIVLGAGQGISMAASAIAGVAGVPPHQAGLASGLLNATRQLGGALGLAVLAALATTHVKDLLDGAKPTAQLLRHAYASGYALAFGVAAGLAAVGVIAAFAAPGKPGN
ncbi:MFS transporter [Streptomyces cylindrosporus]|uniref:MFS transporter n=1 Tax=Streptomyces cylindrosporus TaxID=2927583 RepID=A0ABS9XZ60_9ACTN|nr:MFS transporter [Streptomyces cylindrosporus]MCI3270044.1 MFS transporter [Streptomyces cylindrosporus]